MYFFSQLLKRISGQENMQSLTLQDAVVWGFISTGGGYANMEEVFSFLGIKPIDKKSFYKTEAIMGKVRAIHS